MSFRLVGSSRIARDIVAMVISVGMIMPLAASLFLAQFKMYTLVFKPLG